MAAADDLELTPEQLREVDEMMGEIRKAMELRLSDFQESLAAGELILDDKKGSDRTLGK